MKVYVVRVEDDVSKNSEILGVFDTFNLAETYSKEAYQVIEDTSLAIRAYEFDVNIATSIAQFKKLKEEVYNDN